MRWSINKLPLLAFQLNTAEITLAKAMAITDDYGMTVSSDLIGKCRQIIVEIETLVSAELLKLES